MRGQAAGFHEGVDRQAVQNAEASEVKRDASDLSAAPIDSANAGEAVIADKLVEDVPAHLEIFVDLDVDQSAFEDEIADEFDLLLQVISREEFIVWLLDPANSDICRDQLGIAPSMTPDLAAAYERAREAAKDVADNWDRIVRRSGRPLISLNAVGATPAEAVRFNSWRICSRIVRATSVAVGRPVLFWVTSR
jgi:hypothetical protein